MNFKEKYMPKLKYGRTINVMDELLVLLEISVIPRTSTYYYHYCFGNYNKPSLGVAFHPEDGIVGYISFFIMNEKIDKINTIPQIKQKKTGLSFYDERFHFDHLCFIYEKQFKILKNNNDIWILYESACEKEFDAYPLGSSNYLLFINREFMGLKMEDFNEQEMQELYRAKCL